MQFQLKTLPGSGRFINIFLLGFFKSVQIAQTTTWSAEWWTDLYGRRDVDNTFVVMFIDKAIKKKPNSLDSYSMPEIRNLNLRNTKIWTAPNNSED
jgi:hypothetical protein